jgi:hypothetical protein
MVLVGADPEVFVKNQDNKFISGYGMIPGTKHEPHPVDLGAVQVDGMALEFNITPANSQEEFLKNIDSVMSRLESMIPEDYHLDIVPHADFGQEYINNQPIIAQLLGCEPDFDAYSGFENDPAYEVPGLRTAAGHIHVGWTNRASMEDVIHFSTGCNQAKIMDILLGLPSVLLDDNGTKRREMYGSAGSFRPKPYGMEYRVLSNFWLKSEELKKWVYDATVYSFECMAGYADKNYLGLFSDANIQETINKGQKDTAQGMIKDLGVLMP